MLDAKNGIFTAVGLSVNVTLFSVVAPGIFAAARSGPPDSELFTKQRKTLFFFFPTTVALNSRAWMLDAFSD